MFQVAEAAAVELEMMMLKIVVVGGFFYFDATAKIVLA